MSQIKVNGVVDASGGNTATINTYTPTESNMMGKNRIINGDMRIDQRNAGAAVTINTAAYTYTLDRWAGFGQATDGVFTIQRSTIAPAKFVNSLLATVTTADASIGASQFYVLRHSIEGFNVADLGWGAAGAQTVTLSFWVRSSVTGTFSGALTNSAFTRSYPFTFSIAAANTYEYKTVTIAGDTTGTWLTDNGIGINVFFDFGSGSSNKGTAGAWAGSAFVGSTGSVNLIATNGATFYITGVQLEVGSTATPFERRPYGTELMLCQRYCRTLNSDGGTDKAMFSGVAYLNNTIICSYTFPTMRTAPTAVITNPTQLDVVTSTVTSSNNTLDFGSTNFTPNSAQPAVTNTGTPFTAGHGAVVRFDGASVVFSAEL